MKSYKTAATFVAIGGVVTTSWLLSSGSLKSWLGLQGAESAPCFHAPGENVAYDLSYVLMTSTESSSKRGMDSLSQMAAKQQIQLNGLLVFHPLTDKTASVTFKPRDYLIQGHQIKDSEQEFHEPVELSFDDTCQISEMSFDGRQPFRSRELFRSILGLSILDHRAALEDALDITENDVQGKIAVSYTREDTIVTKVRRQVVEPSTSRDNRNLTANFLESESKFHLSQAPNSPRFDQLTAKEVTRVTSRNSSDSAIQAVRMTMRLAKTTEIARSARIPAAKKVVKKPSEAFAGKDATSAYSSIEMQQMPAKDSFTDAVSEFESLMANGDPINAKKKLGAFFLKHPEALASLEDMMANNDFSDEETMHLLFLLARLDTPHAQEVIMDLIGNDNAPAYLRIQSIIASSDIMKPTDETKRSLKELAEKVAHTDQSDSFDMKQRVFNTAINSYGTMANHLREIDPAFEHDAVQSFKNLITENATSPDILQAVLDGAGNFAHEDLLDPISSHLGHGSAEVRASAATALARIDDDHAENLIVKTLQTEANPKVRRTMAQGLASRSSTLTRPNLPAVATALQSEPAAATRSLLVGALGRASTQPEAKKALIEAAARETESSVIQEIGRYVTASELSGRISRR